MRFVKYQEFEADTTSRQFYTGFLHVSEAPGTFKISVVLLKCVHDAASPYLREYCVPVKIYIPVRPRSYDLHLKGCL